MDRPIPVVADEAIQQEFGTGALKVTPGHDPVDFEIGQRQGLEIITVIGLDGNMTDAAGKYAGMERFQTRESVVSELESLGLLEKVEDLRHSVGHCQRCDCVVEPLVSLQWFMNVGSHQDPDSIAGRAHAAVKNGEIQIVPERFGRVYLNWLENIRDWCISRQLWWGHRIPVWYCDGCGQASASIEDLESCPSCGSAELHQDPDVLDTWFSSGLWPHSTLGWPENTDDLRRFYPTSVLECGYDILFFWVARMIMMGIENTGEVPFRTVFLHGLIRDASGAKMSKTRGNTMDPLDLVERYGTDALRFALTTGTAPGNDMRITDGKLEAARNFANKIWNAARYVISAVESQEDSQEGIQSRAEGWRDLPDLEHREDRWIISLLDRLTAEVNQSLESFELGEAQQRLYEFFWNDFCDWYIEMAKIRLRSGVGPSPLPTLAHVLERTLRLMHPFMPFITEEIWRNLIARLPTEGQREGQRSGSAPESVMVAHYPQATNPRLDSQAEEEIALIIQAIRAVRNTRSQLRIPASQQLEAVIEASGPRDTINTIRGVIEEEAEVIRSLSRVEPLHVQDQDSGTGAGTEQRSKGIALVVNPLVIRLTLEGVVDLSAEESRLKGELDGSLKNMHRVEALVSNPNFKAKAKPEVVENEEERLRSLREETQRLEEILAQLSAD
jgi:valyl-tRNA synthetase